VSARFCGSPRSGTDTFPALRRGRGATTEIKFAPSCALTSRSREGRERGGRILIYQEANKSNEAAGGNSRETREPSFVVCEISRSRDLDAD